MLKITPIKSTKIAKLYRPYKNTTVLRRGANCLNSSLLALSILGLSSTLNCCSKENLETNKKDLQQTDSTCVDKEKGTNISIDDSLDIIEHIITI